MGMVGGIGLLGVGVCAIALLAALLLPRVTLQQRAPRSRGLRAVQVTLVVALLAAVDTAIAAASIDSAHPEWLGVPVGIGPGLAVSIGLAVVAATPALGERPGVVRSATLAPRSAWTVGARRHYLAPAVTATVLALALLATGVTASADETGLLRAFTVERPDGGSTASPYPGWFYAVPLLAATALLLLTAVLAMRRIARLPALGDAARSADGAWRRAATAAVSRLATAGLLAYLGGTLLVTGSAIRSAGSGTPLELLGSAVVVIALVAAALACVAFALALAAVASFRAAATEPEPLAR